MKAPSSEPSVTLAVFFDWRTGRLRVVFLIILLSSVTALPLLSGIFFPLSEPAQIFELNTEKEFVFIMPKNLPDDKSCLF